jgi:hypothetical protein
MRARNHVLAALVAGAAAIAVPAAADAASTCSYGLGGPGGFQKAATVADGSGPLDLRVVRSGQFIAVADGAGSLTFCSGPEGFATVTNTDVVNVLGKPPVSTTDHFVLDESGGELAPGLTPESDGKSEIETVFDTGGAGGRLRVFGSGGSDTFRVVPDGGVMIGSDGDVDVRLRHPQTLKIFGGPGDDFMSARGGGSNLASDKNVSFDGEAGSDTLIDSPEPFDALNGGAGDDQLFTVDGRFDTAVAGPGIDRITFDSTDLLKDTFEQATLDSAVGQLRLTPALALAKPGKTIRVKLGWTHPRSWKQLRRIVVRVEHAGTVVVQPASGRAHARGKVTLVGSHVAGHGSKVTAELALRLPRRLAGRELRVNVTAVDNKGHRQLEPYASAIRLAG